MAPQSADVVLAVRQKDIGNTAPEREEVDTHKKECEIISRMLNLVRDSCYNVRWDIYKH